jgi:hypothetical protein
MGHHEKQKTNKKECDAAESLFWCESGRTGRNENIYSNRSPRVEWEAHFLVGVKREALAF